MYKLDKFDESDIKECFKECGFNKCNFKEQNGESLELNSMDDEGNHISVVSINSSLMVELSNGKAYQLADVINDEDDVEILIAYITEYYKDGNENQIKYEVYDCNHEVVNKFNDIYEALSCAECQDAMFIMDVQKNEIIWGHD